MKLLKIKQTPYTPLIFMVIIMFGFIFGNRGKDAGKQVDETNGAQVQTDGSQTTDVSQTTDGSQVSEGDHVSEGDDVSEGDQVSDVNDLTAENNKDAENSQAGQEDKTDAELALVDGTHIQSEIKDEYVKSVVEDYCNRNVVACSSKNMVRYHEKNLYRQSFDEVTGYMALVQMTAEQDTIAQWKIATELENVTVVLVFPDKSYVCLEKNESIECTLPKGESTILYIGQKLLGSIEVKLQENEHITAKRM